MIKQGEREIAVYILIDIFEQNAYNNIILRKALSEHTELNKIQKSFITELVNGTLRNVIHIDYIIDSFSKTKTNKMKSFIRNILRISVYQAKFMKKVPDSAICNEAVKLVKAKGFANLSGFVNGVMRNIIRNLDQIEYPDENKNSVKYLSIYYSYPEWILKYWLKEMDYKTVKNICEIQSTAPVVTICINSLKTDKKSLIMKLKQENMLVTESTANANLLHIKGTSDIGNSNCFKEGLFHVMDASSAAAVCALEPKPNDTVLDICSAPGGKSFYMAYIMENKGKIIARDVHEHKLNLINDSANRLGIEIIQTENRDATKTHIATEEVDALLIDAPCSGFGLLRKKPDIKYTKTFEDIVSLQELQRKILVASYNYVKVGGTLIYSTCTISKKENMDNVEWFLKEYPFELIEVNNIMPQQNYDGFFIAKMIRKA